MMLRSCERPSLLRLKASREEDDTTQHAAQAHADPRGFGNGYNIHGCCVYTGIATTMWQADEGSLGKRK